MKTIERNFDAVLHDWYVLHYQKGHHDTFVLVGTVTGDSKGRFADGRLMNLVSLHARERDTRGSDRLFFEHQVSSREARRLQRVSLDGT